ncbi:acyltransferase [Streptomyces sp. CAU 1734]|uniref:acyltransferase family protein n=1 Tax=Streptomyces sp. CAU 1734 TaxID=3140360 RepID=UPI00326193BE
MSAGWLFVDGGVNGVLDRWLGSLGGVGVSCFFVLCGVVLVWSVREGDRVVLFWRRRFMKIYPNHVVVWVAGVGLAWGAGQALSVGGVVPGLLLVNAWFPEYEVIRGVNGAAWSLGVELVFYALFPLLWVWVRRVRVSGLWVVAGVMVAGMAVVAVVAEVWLPREVLPGLRYGWWQFWLVYFVPVSRLFEFVLGMVVARLVAGGRFPRVPWWVAVGAVVAGYGLVLVIPGVFGLVLPVVVPLCLVVVWGAQADVEGRSGWLARGWMVRLGEISFAFYILHMVVGYYGPARFGSGRQWGAGEAVARIGGWFALTLVLAWVLYRVVELPAMRRWSRPRRAVAGARSVIVAGSGPGAVPVPVSVSPAGAPAAVAVPSAAGEASGPVSGPGGAAEEGVPGPESGR